MTPTPTCSHIREKNGSFETAECSTELNLDHTCSSNRYQREKSRSDHNTIRGESIDA